MEEVGVSGVYHPLGKRWNPENPLMGTMGFATMGKYSDAVSQGRQRAADEKKAQAAIALMKLRHRIKAAKADENSTLPAAPNSPFDWRIFLEWK